MSQEQFSTRFWARVEKTQDCWKWKLSTTSAGYAQFKFKGSRYLGHRVAYELTKGNIPSGLELDHLCRNRACVNPDHLEPVTHRENIIRGLAPEVSKLRNIQITQCPKGHEYNSSNTYFYPNKRRGCKTCNMLANRAYRRRKKIAH